MLSHQTVTRLFFSALVALLVSGAVATTRAEVLPPEFLCDTQYEDCRAPLIQLIQQEDQGIDVAFWFMEDSRYVTELKKRHDAGVPVRVIVDTRANKSKRLNAEMLQLLADAGIPMRHKFDDGTDNILHYKVMLFHGQNVVQFSKANYTDASFDPITPNVNYFDEAVFFTNDSNITNSFRRRLDDLWTDTTKYRNYANITGTPTRKYPLYSIHSSMNFPSTGDSSKDFSNRSVNRYNAEIALPASAGRGIDAIVYRPTDDRHANAMINAVAAGVPVRLIGEPEEYANEGRPFVAKYLDKMWLAGVQIKMRAHAGLMHQASVVMHGLGEVIFGSSNWTTASAMWQDEHNYFYKPSLGKPWFFDWFADQFERKWADTTNYADFVPRSPHTPAYIGPPDSASGLSTSVALTWDGGPWAHLYDIYLGTSPDSMELIENNLQLTDPECSGTSQLTCGSVQVGDPEKYTLTGLQPGTTYYWKIVGKTWALMSRSGPVRNFTTAGTPGGGGGSTTLPFHGFPVPLPGVVQAEEFDNHGTQPAYFDTTAGNSLGAFRSTDVDIQNASEGGYNLGKTRAGEWLKYTVDVATTGTYRFEARVANIGSGVRFHVEIDGVNRTGPITVPDTGGWQAWQTIGVDGVPLTAGTRVVRVVLETNGTSGGNANYNWFNFVATGGASETTPYGGTPAPLPGVVQVERYDISGTAAAFSDSTAGNSGGAFRTDNVDIGPTSDAGSGGYYVGWTRVGEWMKYTVNVAESRQYTLGMRVANVGTGAKFRIEVDGVDVTGAIDVPNTGGWDVWQTITRSGISLSAGQHVIRLVMATRNVENSGVGNFGYFSFE